MKIRWRAALSIVVVMVGFVAVAAWALPPRHPNTHSPPVDIVEPVPHLNAQSLAAQIAAGETIPVWSSSATSPVDGKRYTFTMVGNSPLHREADPVTTIPTDIIPIRFKLKDASGATHIIDPTQSDSHCLSGQSALNDMLASPVFQDHPYTMDGINVGNVQYADAFQRMNFGRHVLMPGAINPGYEVELAPTVRPTITDTPPATDYHWLGGSGCGHPAEINENWWKAHVPGKLFTSLRSYLVPHHLAVFLFDNVTMFKPTGSGSGGFHTAAPNPAYNNIMQTYATVVYKPSIDVSGIAHEIGEWMDDPFVDNNVPAWGNTGQVQGKCSTLLEVGDPLSGTRIEVPMPNGITYHPQELATLGWFLRIHSPLPGWWSDNGTFTSNAGPVCSQPSG